MQGGVYLLPILQYMGFCLGVVSFLVIINYMRKGTGSYLLSIFLLFRMRYVRCLMAIWWIFLHGVFIRDMGICKFLRRYRLLVCGGNLECEQSAIT